jgi:4-diphosphocytidyl-2-C-methyl-D-erythritol kinase
MLVYPSCKINLGLNITSKRADGFHNIETVFYPVKWADALEITEGGNEPFQLISSGLKVDGPTENNIIYKAWKLIVAEHKLTPIKVHLHKVLPMGAGLGGGSSDAAFFLKTMNNKFGLNLSTEKLTSMARYLGADCAFFIENKPVFARGKGDEFERVWTDLSNYFILIVYPGIISNTKEAYEGVSPALPQKSIQTILQQDIETWKSELVNDFEKSIFKKYPEIGELKQKMYDQGAIYASLSGSGSSVFGIFKTSTSIHFPQNYSYFLQIPAYKM